MLFRTRHPSLITTLSSTWLVSTISRHGGGRLQSYRGRAAHGQNHAPTGRARGAQKLGRVAPRRKVTALLLIFASDDDSYLCLHNSYERIRQKQSGDHKGWIAMGRIVELPSIKPRSTSRRQGLRKLSPDLISKARDETATQVTRVGLTFLGTAAFCLLSLLSPDTALLGGSEKINVQCRSSGSCCWDRRS
jgi:hypothetical protein